VSEWIISFVEQTGYLGVATLMFIETVFPPIPSEVIMSIAGMHAGQGKMSLPLVIVMGTSGAMLGNYFWYLVARLIGIDRLKTMIERYGRWLTLDWPEVERARLLFDRYGGVFVCIGRMLPTLRSLMSIPAGLLRMKQSTFLIWSTIGTAGWTGILASGGWVLGRNFRNVEDFVGPISLIVIGAIIVAYIWRVITWRPTA
jgi:membrane protein DedA with SNARE-associated domain